MLYKATIIWKSGPSSSHVNVDAIETDLHGYILTKINGEEIFVMARRIKSLTLTPQDEAQEEVT